MKIIDILHLLSESIQLNEGFYAYHCTTADIDEFKDDHTNKPSGAGMFWGIGTYFEVLTADGNFDDYGNESHYMRRNGGGQYKVWVDLDDNQVLDMTKSLNDYGIKMDTQESLKFILNSPPCNTNTNKDDVGLNLYQYITKFLEIKKENNNFNSFYLKCKSLKEILLLCRQFVNILYKYTKKFKNFELSFQDTYKELYNFLDIIKLVVSFSNGELDESGNISEEQMKQIEMEAQEGWKGTIQFLKDYKTKFLPNVKKIKHLFNTLLQNFLFLIKLAVNKCPMFYLFRYRSTPEDVKWFQKTFNVYGKIVPETSLNDGGDRKYLILWKTSGIVKKVGQRKRKTDKFTDEIEAEADDDAIQSMLDNGF